MADRAQTSTSPLAEELCAQLSHPELGHLTIIRDDYDEENFGNALLVFQADGVLLRFIRDRGLVTVDVGASNRFLSLDFLAFRQRWTDFVAIAHHYSRPPGLPSLRPGLPSDETENVYANLLGALAASDEAEAEAERIATHLEATAEPALSQFRDAPTGPYFGVSLPSCKSRAPKDALTTLNDHWSEIADAMADEQWFRRACDEEPEFWKSIRQPTSSPGEDETRSLAAT